MSSPHIAAIICTHNRAGYLAGAIASLLHQDIAESYEVIVVDNASTDATSAVVEPFLPNRRLRYVLEPTLGLSVARNTGAMQTSAPLLAYLDDDAIASAQWLQVLHAAFQTDEHLAIAGGRVLLDWDGKLPPRWLSANLAGSLGAYDLGNVPVEIQQPGQTPRGVNYALRRDFWESVGGFSTQLGRVGTTLLSNEELHLTELALRQGKTVRYLPDAEVIHRIAPERRQQSWFLQRSWWQGVSEYQRERLTGQTGVGQLQRGGDRLLRGLYHSLRYGNDPAMRFDNLVYAYGQLSYLGLALRHLLWH
ncbi:MAG: hypothetical protein Fur0046_32660 [Cyanobacteria bacterium J069]|nr:MAG: glycosyltransferase family 2 protein [Cyanobacteria bacterium J069]